MLITTSVPHPEMKEPIPEVITHAGMGREEELPRTPLRTAGDGHSGPRVAGCRQRGEAEVGGCEGKVHACGRALLRREARARKEVG